MLTVLQITNFIIQRDNRLNIEIAQSSRRIAEESRRDNLLNIELAKATAQVAEETRQDSAAMKTIAVLTLTFLPGTFIAVSPNVRCDYSFSPLTTFPVILQHERRIHLQSRTRSPHRIAQPVDFLRCDHPRHNRHLWLVDMVAWLLANPAQGATRARFEGR